MSKCWSRQEIEDAQRRSLWDESPAAANLLFTSKNETRARKKNCDTFLGPKKLALPVLAESKQYEHEGPVYFAS